MSKSKNSSKLTRKEWWHTLTLDEQADYVYEQQMAKKGHAEYQKIYSDLYKKREFLV